MIPARARYTANVKALVVLSAILVPSVAGAVVLPERGPIPVDRPAIDQAAVPVDHMISAVRHRREVVQISTVEQEIPDARQDVRVVGSNFLPPAEESIDFALADSSQLSTVSNVERFVAATIAALFDRAEDEQPVQVAATAH